MNSLSGFGSGVWREQEDLSFIRPGTVSSSSADHCFGHAELHLARLEVGNADDQTSDQLFRVGIRGFNSSEHLTVVVSTQVERQLEQLLRLFDGFRR